MRPDAAHDTGVASQRVAMPPGGGAVGERWRTWRDRMLASSRFQRWASAFPLTRPIARRRARALFDLCAGFVYSQVLLACVRTRLLETLGDGPQTLAGVSHRCALPPQGAERLLEAAISLRLVERRSGGRFGLGPLGAAMLGNPGVAAMVEHHALLYQDLQDPVALLRAPGGGGRLERYWAYARAAHPAGLADDEVAAYTRLMSASQQLVAEQILDAYPLRRHGCLLDVGGGDGTFLVAAAAREPRLRLMLFDLPAVAARARARIDAAGLADRAVAIGGDFLAGALPQGADVVSLIRVVHDHDDERALAILRAVHAALPRGGVLLLAEPMAQTRGAEPMGAAYFGMYLHAMGSGRPRSSDALGGLLRAARFEHVRAVSTRHPLQTRLLVARRKL